MNIIILKVCYFLYVTNSHEGAAATQSAPLKKSCVTETVSTPSLPLISVIFRGSTRFPEHTIRIYIQRTLHKQLILL